MKSFSVLLLGCFFVSCANQPSETDRENENFKGLVKSVFTIEYNALDKFGEGDIVRDEPDYWGTEYIEFDSIGNYTHKNTYTLRNVKKDTKSIYDENGFEIYWASYDDEGKDIRWGDKIKYDEKGNEIERLDIKNGEITKGETKYDEYGNLIYHLHNGDKTYYEYIDNRLVEEKDIFSWGSPWITTYKYDKNGNQIEQRRNFQDKSYRVWHYTFDKNNRISTWKRSFAKTEKSDLDLEIFVKNIYASDSVSSPFIVEEWDKNGILTGKEHYFWVHNHIDTLSCIQLNKDFTISMIKCITKHNGQKEALSYEIKSEKFTSENFNIVNGKKVSSIDEDGRECIYEYEGDKLIKETHQYSDDKLIITYENGKKKTVTSYDKHNKVLSMSEFKYNGDANNGIIKVTLKGKDGKSEINEMIIENGNVVKETFSLNGVPTTITMKYNSFGDIIEQTEGNKITTYKYEYDKLNNWITKNIFVNGKIDKIIERAIVYY